ncbi:hypothetical protein C5167_010679 [Papaver somniferum]|uniref:PUM-HD domain-containing protein n=1 Tax=Papaver somniferum TaxID=3469 RepID=A0A4Y7K4Z1_PAPSO|nr:pumilio homolog 12-like isoform X2 [Papaver somniferum]RZC66989.1 hypothetical protein C5167_010679 [Papaver somniferum]
MASWNRGGGGARVVDQGEEDDDQEKVVNNGGMYNNNSSSNNYPPQLLYESLEDQLNSLNLFNHQQNQHNLHRQQQNLQDLYSDFSYGIVPFPSPIPPVLPSALPVVNPGSLQQPYANEMLLSRNTTTNNNLDDFGLPLNYRINSYNTTARMAALGMNDYGVDTTSMLTQGLRGGFMNSDFGLYRGNSLYPAMPIMPSSRLYTEELTSSRSRMRKLTNHVNGFVGRNHGRLNRSSVLSSTLISTNVEEEEDRTRRNAECFENIKWNQQNWSLLIDMAKDQNGSKFIQGKLETGSYQDIQFIITVLTTDIKKLVVNSAGNFLVQKMFLKCTEAQIGEIVNILTNNGHELINICLDDHGTRSVQKLLESLTSEQHITKVLNVLSKGTVELTKDTNGHHVIQRCLKTFSNEENKHLFRALARHCVDIARDRNGCCVLQQFILKIDEHLRDHFVGEITQNALVLAQDPYGNYVVQYVVGQKIKETTRALVKNLKGHFETLSTNKFSSHLVEKFLKESDDEFVIKFIIDELINKSNILMLLQDQYANFVMQSALDVAKEVSMFNLIVNVIEMHYQSLRNHPYGKRVVLHMNQLIRDQQYNHHHLTSSSTIYKHVQV